MRVLVLAEFDPAGVLMSHQDIMLAAGHDFRVALHSAYTPRQLQADYVFERVADPGEVGGAPRVSSIGNRSLKWVWVGRGAWGLNGLLDFARTADVVVECPGIGQPWADQPQPFMPRWGLDGLRQSLFGVDSWLEATRQAKHVAYIHGSVNAWHQREAYRQWYADRRMPVRLATSTVDYAVEIGADYLPPWIHMDKVEVDRAPLRNKGEPLVLGHFPTNPTIANTRDFIRICNEGGHLYNYGHRIDHERVLRLKSMCHVGFDHLRGCFSVNTLECMALGVAPLFRNAYGEHLQRLGLPNLDGFSVQSVEQLKGRIRLLEEEEDVTRALQAQAWQVYQEHFSYEPVAERVRRFYLSL